MTTAPIPIVDLSESPSDNAKRIDHACRDVGFFGVVGHGMDEDLLADMSRVTTAFFDLPLQEKLDARHRDPAHPYGYFPAGGEALARSRGVTTPPDLKESFNLAPPSHHRDGTGRFGGVDRLWPRRPKELNQVWSTYYDSMVALSERLLDLFALALDTDPEVFHRCTDQHLSALRALNYPPVAGPAEPGQLRAGAHSDYGTLTVLYPGPGRGGLEVLNREGVWQPVQPIAGGFVVNIGDMMQRWTNDQWRSTLHRVALPHDTAERRQAVAFFHQPNWDAEITVLDTCVDPAHPRRHAAVLAGPWLEGKFDQASG